MFSHLFGPALDNTFYTQMAHDMLIIHTVVLSNKNNNKPLRLEWAAKQRGRPEQSHDLNPNQT